MTTHPDGTSPATHRRVLDLSIPALLALAADPLLSLVDTAMVGRLGAASLGALGINVAVFAAAFMVFNFLAYGTTAEVARHRGAGRPERAASAAVSAWWLAVGLGLAVSAILLVGARPITAAMGASGELVDPALTYLRIRAFASVSVLVVLVGHGWFRGIGDTRTPLAITVVVNLVSAAISAVLIFGVGLGVAGAAIGTTIAQTGGAIAFCWLARRSIGPVSLRPVPQDVRRVAAISRDLFVRAVALIGGLAVTTAAAARMGTEAVASHHVARELWLLSALVLDGFAIAGQTLIASALGAGRADVARADARRLLAWGTGFGGLVGVVYLLGGGAVVRLLTDDATVVAGATSVLWVVALLQPIGGAVFVLDGVLMGAGDHRFLRNSIVLAVLVGLLPVTALALTMGWGLGGLWAAMTALMVIRLVAILRRLTAPEWAVAEDAAVPGRVDPAPGA